MDTVGDVEAQDPLTRLVVHPCGTAAGATLLGALEVRPDELAGGFGDVGRDRGKTGGVGHEHRLCADGEGRLCATDRPADDPARRFEHVGVDGALVGGASLKADEFKKMIKD